MDTTLTRQNNAFKNELRNELMNDIKNMVRSFFQMNTASSSGSGLLPNNTVANQRGDLKAITTLSEIVECLALADLDRSTTSLSGIAEDVFVKVGKFHFLADFIVVDYVVDPRIPLILGRPFLRTGCALIDVYGEELTLRVNDEAITFKVGQTLRYSYNNAKSVNRIDVIDVSCKEYAQEVLGFLDSSTSGNPTPSLDPVLSTSLPSLTPFEGELHFEDIKTIKSSIDDPSELDLKDLPSYLEYAFLEGTDQLLVIISKELKDEEKAALLKVLKSHKWAIGWKISDIKGIDPRFCTHKILLEDDFKIAVQHQRRVDLKIHEVIKKEVVKLLDAGLIYPISDSPDSFSSCLSHLDKMLKRCEDTNLVLNWKKCDFMVKEGIVLGHKISKFGIEVDKAKIDVIAKLPHPTSVKGIRSFLGDVFPAKKPLISSWLAIMDPPGDIMVPTTPLRKSLIPDSFGIPFTEMPNRLGHTV
ncbi:reverse transcriptase domain-containing protein [Tanacetum coccineum]